MNTYVRMSPWHFIKLIRTSLISLMLFSVGLQTLPAFALPATSTPSEKVIDCLGDLQGTISATPQLIPLGQATTLRWNVTVPSSCTGISVKLYVGNQVVAATGSRSIQPTADTSYRLHAALPAVYGGARSTLATTVIRVNIPLVDPTLPFCPNTTYGDADRDGVNDGKEDCLLHDYAPVLYMPFGYDWIRPANVDWYLERTTLRFHHNNCSDDGILPLGTVNQNSLITQSHRTKQGLLSGCDHTSTSISSKFGPFDEDQHFFLQAPLDSTHHGSSDPAQWKVYGHVYKNSIGGLNLQYWFFYPYNDNVASFNHEGDWESIIVRLNSAFTADSIFFCQHGDCSTHISANNVSWLDGTHPIGWVADGSHATYPSQLACDLAPIQDEGEPLLNCQTRDGYRWFTWANGKLGRAGYQGGGVVNVGEKNFPLNGQYFLQYYSRWGELGETSVTSGPRTPSYQSSWLFGAQ